MKIGRKSKNHALTGAATKMAIGRFRRTVRRGGRPILEGSKRVLGSRTSFRVFTFHIGDLEVWGT